MWVEGMETLRPALKISVSYSHLDVYTRKCLLLPSYWSYLGKSETPLHHIGQSKTDITSSNIVSLSWYRHTHQYTYLFKHH